MIGEISSLIEPLKSFIIGILQTRDLSPSTHYKHLLYSGKVW